MEKQDCFVYYNCVSGNCPLIIEEEKYGVWTSTCKDYCGTNSFSSCKNCCFEGSYICNECIHKEKTYSNSGNDCDLCRHQFMTGRDGTIEDCRRRELGLQCQFEECSIDMYIAGGGLCSKTC